MTRLPRAGRCLALTAALLGTPLLASAQEELPEEARDLQARGEARRLADAAFDAIERYGRGLPNPPIPWDAARKRAWSRARLPLDPRQPKPRPRPLPRPERDLDELIEFRDALRARLRRLDPSKVSEPPPLLAAPRPPVRLRIFEVQDLVTVPRDHIAPNVGLGAGLDPSGAGGGDAFADDESATAGVGLGPDKLIELLEAHVRDPEDERGSLSYSGGRILARLPLPQLTATEAFLQRLRRERGGLVDLEIRVYRMPPAVFAEVRPTAGALSNAAEAALGTAVREGRADLLGSHHVVAHDGQRVHVRRGGSRSFVADLMTNATGVIPVLTPRVAVVNEGLVVEVRPLVHRARQVVLLDVALSLSRLDEPIPTRELEDMQLELPQMPIARIASTTCVPLGRGALLGGVFKLDAPAQDPLTCVVYVRPQLVQAD